jgi:hypothetical protein
MFLDTRDARMLLKTYDDNEVVGSFLCTYQVVLDNIMNVRLQFMLRSPLR